MNTITFKRSQIVNDFVHIKIYFYSQCKTYSWKSVFSFFLLQYTKTSFWNIAQSTKTDHDFLFSPQMEHSPPLQQIQCHISKPALAVNFQNWNQIHYTGICDLGTTPEINLSVTHIVKTTQTNILILPKKLHRYI